MDIGSAKVISLDDRRHQTGPYDLQPKMSHNPQGPGISLINPDPPPWVDLYQKVARLEKEVKEIKDFISGEVTPERSPVNYLELRDIPYPQIKEEIAGYFLKNDGKEIGYEELIEELRIDPKLVVQACCCF